MKPPKGRADRTLNTLTLQTNAYIYQVDGQTQPNPHKQTDFIIDGLGLSERFDFESNRPWFGQTTFEYPAKDVQHRYCDQLMGTSKQLNQLGNERVVLYSCHCGCHYCGIISCLIEDNGETIVWRDIRFEEETTEVDEDDMEVLDGIMYRHVIEAFTFERQPYLETITQYIQQLT